MDSTAMNIEQWNERADWVTYGKEKGWVTDSICATHDGTYDYMNDEERKEYDEGGDPCDLVLKLL
jgi:hypothetical protein